MTELKMEVMMEEIATDTAGDILTGVGIGLAILGFLGVTC